MKDKYWDKKKDIIWEIWRAIKRFDDLKNKAVDETEKNFLQSREAEAIRFLIEED